MLNPELKDIPTFTRRAFLKATGTFVAGKAVKTIVENTGISSLIPQTVEAQEPPKNPAKDFSPLSEENVEQHPQIFGDLGEYFASDPNFLKKVLLVLSGPGILSVQNVLDHVAYRHNTATKKEVRDIHCPDTAEKFLGIFLRDALEDNGLLDQLQVFTQMRRAPGNILTNEETIKIILRAKGQTANGTNYNAIVSYLQADGTGTVYVVTDPDMRLNKGSEILGREAKRAKLEEVKSKFWDPSNGNSPDAQPVGAPEKQPTTEKNLNISPAAVLGTLGLVGLTAILKRRSRPAAANI